MTETTAGNLIPNIDTNYQIQLPINNRANESIPLIIFESQNKSDSDTYIDVVSDKDTTLEITLTSEEEAVGYQEESNKKDHEIDLESRFYTAFLTTNRSPVPSKDDPTNNNEDQIKIKTTDKDSDTVFLISNTEVKVMESNPTPFASTNLLNQDNNAPPPYPISSIEDVVIDFAYNNASSMVNANAREKESDLMMAGLSGFDTDSIIHPRQTYEQHAPMNINIETKVVVNHLLKEPLNIQINTPTNVSIPSNLTRDDPDELQYKNFTVPFEQFGGNTTIFVDSEADSSKYFLSILSCKFFDLFFFCSF